MTIDCCRFAGVERFEDLFPYMPGNWARHFDRYEWTGAVGLASNHIRVSDQFQHPQIPRYDPNADGDELRIVLSHQALAVNGWADTVAAGVFVDACNAYALDRWVSDASRIAAVVNPFDPSAAAAQVRALKGNPHVAAISVPLASRLLGEPSWDPLYEACIDAGLPILVRFSGVEGSYAGAPPLAGAPHTNPLSRHILMPQLAESNVASLIFQGTLLRYPELRFLFAGFGFRWLPSLMRRIDQEWRNFRSDTPWVRERPAVTLLRNIYVGTHPIGEVPEGDNWQGEFEKGVFDRLVFCSNAPFDTDSPAEVVRRLSSPLAERLRTNGEALFAQSLRAAA